MTKFEKAIAKIIARNLNHDVVFGPGAVRGCGDGYFAEIQSCETITGKGKTPAEALEDALRQEDELRLTIDQIRVGDRVRDESWNHGTVIGIFTENPYSDNARVIVEVDGPGKGNYLPHELFEVEQVDELAG